MMDKVQERGNPRAMIFKLCSAEPSAPAKATREETVMAVWAFCRFCFAGYIYRLSIPRSQHRFYEHGNRTAYDKTSNY
jgi:hypothetical protein